MRSNFLFKSTLVTALLVYVSIQGQEQVENCGTYTLSHIDIKHREHKGVGFDQGYSTVAAFFMHEGSPSIMPFIDGRLHVFNNAYLSSNVGVGARFGEPSSFGTFGINGYFDYRNYKSLSTYQASAGLEFLHEHIDVRMNGYYPFSGKVKEESITHRQVIGHTTFVNQKIRYALPMVDGEIGTFLGGVFKEVNMYMAFGYYYLFKQTSQVGFSVGHVSGGKVRAAVEAFKYLFMGAEYTYDGLFRGRVNGYLGVSIPLGPRAILGSTKERYPYKESYCDKKASILARKGRSVIHNEIIPFVNKKYRYPERS